MKSPVQVAHTHLETALQICDDCVQLLIVENPTEFYRMVADLDGQFDGIAGEFVFSREGKIIDPSKCGVMIADLFHFDLNDKRLITLLQKRLENFAFGEKLPLFNELSAKTVAFLEELSFYVPFALEYAEPQPIDYLKAAGIKFAKQYDSLEEKIVCFINACIELKACEFFVFVHLKSVLSDEKLAEIYAHCRREQVGLLLIESGKQRPILFEEKAVIITEDLCEILENYEEI